MEWVQNYVTVGNSVIGSACVAAIPLLILFYMLAVRKSKGHIAAIAGLAGALIVAVPVWGMPIMLANCLDCRNGSLGLQHDRGIGRI